MAWEPLQEKTSASKSEGSDEENVTEFGEKWQIFRLQAAECCPPVQRSALRDNLWHSLPTLLGIYIAELPLSSLYASISLYALLA